MALFLCDLLLIALAAWWLTGQPSFRQLIPRGTWLVAAAIVVLTAELLAFVRLLAAPWAWLCLHLLLAVMAYLWSRRRLPACETPAAETLTVMVPETDDPLWLRHLVTGLGATVVLGYALLAYLCVRVPPNNCDSLTYHLPRIGYYLQQSSLAHFPTPNSRQTEFPYNAELLILWQVLFLKRDFLANLVQWGAGLIAAGTIIEVARSIGATPVAARLAGLLFLTLPMVVFQATSTQNDLVVTWFALAVVLHTLRWSRTAQPADGLYAVMAAGLAIGTKNTFLLCLPGLAVVSVWLAARRSHAWLGSPFQHISWRTVPSSLAALLLAAALGGGWLWENLRGTGLILNQNQIAVQQIAEPSLTAGLSNLVRYAYQGFDWTGLPDKGKRVAVLMACQRQTAEQLVILAGPQINDDRWTIGTSPTQAPWPMQPYALHEDLAWFGPNGWLWLAPAYLCGVICAVRNRNHVVLALALVPLSFLIGSCLFLKWQPWAGRLFCLPVGLAAPIAAYGVSTWRGPVLRLYLLLIVLCGVLTLWTCATENRSKRLKKIATHTDLELRFHERPEMGRVAQWITTHRPQAENPTAQTIGFFGHADDMDYVCFLPDFTWQVRRFADAPAPLPAILATGELDLAVIHQPLHAMPSLPAEFYGEPIAPQWTGIRRRTSISASQD